MRIRQSLVYGAAVAMVLTMTACDTSGGADPDASAGAAVDPGPTDDGDDGGDDGGGGEPVTIRAAVSGDEDTLNPYTYVTGFPGWNMLMMQYDSVMQLDAQGQPQPWLASSIEANDDLTTWTLEIRDDATWHDGEPLTAADVAFSYEYFVDSAEGRFSRDLSGMESVTVDGNTVEVTLGAPNPAFDLVALADVPIIPEHVWADVDDPANAALGIESNVGSGPFELVEYTPDQSYRFEANADYFLGAPAVDELVVVVFADDAGANAAIRSGEVDVIFNGVSPEQITQLDAQDPLEIMQGPEFSTQMVNFDTSKAPFDDVVVRRAMAMAIDGQDIVDTVYLGAATVGSPGWIHPDKDVYNPDVTPTVDPEAAATMLEDAGYTDADGDGVREFDGEPMEFELLVASGDSLRLRLAELVSEMLGRIGIEATVASVEQATWEEAVWPGFDIANGRNYELAMWGWSAPVQANTIRVAELVHSDPGIGFLNLTGFANDEVDQLSAALLEEADEAVAAESLGQLQAAIADQVPFIMLAYPDGAYVFDSEVYAGWEFIQGQGIVNKLSLLAEDARP